MNSENWFVAARSDQVKRQPIRRFVLERAMVLFRDSKGIAHALEDRCPHKHVALSLGRVVGDSIECPYHGLCFDGGGRCTVQPARAPHEPVFSKRVPRFPVIEQDDWIWVYVDASSPTTLPPRYVKTSPHGWFELHNVIEAPIELVLENGLDCSHTGIAHRGLFRSYPSQVVTSAIEETPTGMKVVTRGERASGKLDATAVAGSGAEIEHIDEFIRPHTIKVDYRVGRSHFVTILVCTPETATRTRAYTRQGVLVPPMTALATLVSAIVTRKVVAQDKRILENQSAQIALFGAPAHPTTNADAPTRWLRRVLRPRAPSLTTPVTREEVQYTL